MVGAFLWPMLPPMPTEVGLPSVNVRSGSWQLAQATVPSTDKRPSKKSFLPSAIFSGVCGLSGGIAACVCSTGKPTCRGDLGWADGPPGNRRSTFSSVCLLRSRKWPSSAQQLPATFPFGHSQSRPADHGCCIEVLPRNIRLRLSCLPVASARPVPLASLLGKYV